MYALLSILQISSMNLLYVKMLMSFMKLSTSILILNTLHFLIRLMLKNKKKINEMKDFYDMSAFILRMLLICLLNLNDVSQFSRKSIENILYTLHATYIKHNLYADFLLKLEKLLKEFSCDRFTVQDERNLLLLKF